MRVIIQRSMNLPIFINKQRIVLPENLDMPGVHPRSQSFKNLAAYEILRSFLSEFGLINIADFLCWLVPRLLLALWMCLVALIGNNSAELVVRAGIC